MSSSEQVPRTYDAFLSYSSHDAVIAQRIQTSIEAFLRTPLRRRRLRVFRDRTSLGASSRLWSNIRTKLDDSKAFIWLGSPRSAASAWATEEFIYWLRNRGTGEVIILIADGDVVWDRKRNVFDWKRTNALPKEVGEFFSEEPQYLDYRWIGNSLARSPLKDSRDLDSTASIASTLLAKPKDELIGQHVDDEERAHTFRRRAILSVATLCIFLVIAAVYAYQSRTSARINRANQLATEGRNEQTDKRLLESVSSISQAWRLQATPRVRAAALFVEHPSLTFARRLNYAGPAIRHLAFSPDSTVLVVANQNGIVLWKFGKEKLQTFPFEEGVSRLRYVSADMFLVASDAPLATGDGKEGLGKVELYRVRPNGDLEGTTLFRYAGSALGFGPSGKCFLDYSRRQGIIYSADVQQNGTIVSQSQVYGEPFGAADAAGERQTFLESPTSLAPAAVAFNNTCGIESNVAIATGIDDPRRTIGSVRNVKGVALLVLSPVGSISWLAGHRGAVHAVTYSPDGEGFLTGGEDGQICFWDNHPNEIEEPRQRVDNGSPVAALGFHPGGTYFASAGSDLQIRIWNRQGDLLQVVSGPTQPIRYVEFTPDGQFLVTAGDTEILLWRIESSPALPIDSGAKPSGCAAFIANGESVAVTDSREDIRLYRSRDLFLLRVLQIGEAAEAARRGAAPDTFMPGEPQSCIGSRFSAHLFVGTSTGFIVRWDTAASKVNRIYQREGAAVRSLGLCPRDQCLCAALSDGKIRVFDAATGAVTKEWSLSGEPKFVEFGNDCASAVYSTDPGRLSVTDIEKNHSEDLVLTRATSRAETRSTTPDYAFARFDPTGERVAVAAQDNVVEVFDLARRARIAVLESESPDRISALAFASPDILVAGQSKIVSRGSPSQLLAWAINSQTVVDRYPLERRLLSVVELKLDTRREQLLVLARNALAFDQGGESELRVLGSPLVYPRHASAADLAPGTLDPDPGTAALWPAVWTSLCRAALVTQRVNPLVTAWYGNPTPDNALNPLREWLTAYPAHPYSFQATMYLQQMQKEIASTSPIR